MTLPTMTGADPCANRKDLVATDPESTERGALVAGWAELPGSDRGLTTAEALRLLRDNPAQYATLRAVLTTRSGDLPSPRSVGMKLNAIRGRIIQGRSLHTVPAGNNTQAWMVVGVRPQTGPECGLHKPGPRGLAPGSPAGTDRDRKAWNRVNRK
jgi:hypothetical protein